MFSQAEQVDRHREEEEVIKKAAGDAGIHFLINLLSQLILQQRGRAPSRRGLNQFRF